MDLLLRGLTLVTTCALLAGATAEAQAKTFRLRFRGVRGKVRRLASPGAVATPLGNARVTFQPITGKKTFACLTRPDGSYAKTLPKGGYFLSVSLDGYQSVSTKPNVVHVQGLVVRDFELRKVQGGFRGTVYERLRSGKQGPPIGSAELAFERKGTDFLRRTRSDGNGRYQIWLPPGQYVVWVKKPGYSRNLAPFRLLTSVFRKRTTEDLHFPRRPLKLKFRAALVYGYVWERTGPMKGDEVVGPVNGVELTFTRRGKPMLRTATTSPNGNFYKIVLPEGAWDVALRKNGFVMMQPFDYTVDVDNQKIREDWYLQKAVAGPN